VLRDVVFRRAIGGWFANQITYAFITQPFDKQYFLSFSWPISKNQAGVALTLSKRNIVDLEA